MSHASAPGEPSHRSYKDTHSGISAQNGGEWRACARGRDHSADPSVRARAAPPGLAVLSFDIQKAGRVHYCAVMDFCSLVLKLDKIQRIK